MKTKGINYAGSAACTIAAANRVAAGVSVNLERRKTRCVKFREEVQTRNKISNCCTNVILMAAENPY